MYRLCMNSETNTNCSTYFLHVGLEDDGELTLSQVARRCDILAQDHFSHHKHLHKSITGRVMVPKAHVL